MIKFLFFLTLFFSSPVFSAPSKIPKNQHLGVLGTATTHAFLNQDKKTYLLEYQSTPALKRRSFQNMGVGFRYRFLEGLKVGINYLRQYGNRYDEDWVPGLKWHWKDTESRVEDLVRLDIIPRFDLGSNFVFEWRQRFLHSFMNQKDTFITRPGLNYFYEGHGHRGNILLQYEVFFPTNYGRMSPNSEWTYLTFLYHASETCQIGPTFSYVEERWSSTQDFTDKTGERYQVENHYWLVGLVANFRVEL